MGALNHVSQLQARIHDINALWDMLNERCAVQVECSSGTHMIHVAAACVAVVVVIACAFGAWLIWTLLQNIIGLPVCVQWAIKNGVSVLSTNNALEVIMIRV